MHISWKMKLNLSAFSSGTRVVSAFVNMTTCISLPHLSDMHCSSILQHIKDVIACKPNCVQFIHILWLIAVPMQVNCCFKFYFFGSYFCFWRFQFELLISPTNWILKPSMIFVTLYSYHAHTHIIVSTLGLLLKQSDVTTLTKMFTFMVFTALQGSFWSCNLSIGNSLLSLKLSRL